MKRISFIMIVLLAVSSFSCGLLDKADVTFEATLPLEFKSVDEQLVSSTPVSYSDTQVLDATKNADVAKYKDKIKDFKVKKVYYEIYEYTGSGVVFSNGSLKVSASGASKTLASKTQLTLANIPKTEFTTTEIDVAGLNDLGAALKADKMATVVLAGTFSKTPVKFKVRAYFDVSITASALK